LNATFFAIGVFKPNIDGKKLLACDVGFVVFGMINTVGYYCRLYCVFLL